MIEYTQRTTVLFALRNFKETHNNFPGRNIREIRTNTPCKDSRKFEA